MTSSVAPEGPDRGGQRARPLVPLLARNTLLNLLTQALIIIIGLASLPYIVQKLSEERFGLLSLIWGFIGYFTLLDFGISRANSKFLAEALMQSDEGEVRRLAWTSMTVTGALGILTGGIIFVCTPFIVHQLLNIDPALTGQASEALMLAALSVPFMLVFGTLKGFQVALQRFDVVNAFQIVMGGVQWVGSVLLLWRGFGLREIIFLTVGIRILLTLAAFGVLPYLIPGIFRRIVFWHAGTFRKLISFGGWLTISQIISPMFLYLDRVLIGMFLTLTAISYYTVPQEALTRLLILPMSLTTTLFPALSEQSVLDQASSAGPAMYRRSLKYLLILMIPVAFLLVTCAPDILRLWMGRDFAAQSQVIFQILSIGLFFNAIAQLPSTVLHAYGRPDLTAKYHVLELPVMIGLNIVLIPWIGLIGVAITWSARVILDAALLFYGVRRHCPGMLGTPARRVLSARAAIHLSITVVVGALMMTVAPPVVKIIVAPVFLALYAFLVWSRYFDEADKQFVLQFRSRIFR